jgi:hypothetical protein
MAPPHRQALNIGLSGKVVYSKDPPSTIRLLKEIFSAVDIPQGEIAVLDLEELFLNTLREKPRLVLGAKWRLRQIKKQVVAAHPGYRLRGGAIEIPYFLEVWKRVCVESRA